jgi:excisionase family DNA binding protein
MRTARACRAGIAITVTPRLALRRRWSVGCPFRVTMRPRSSCAVPVYFTPDEVAARFKVPRARVLAWARSGRLHGVKVGRVWRFTEEDLDAFLQAEQERQEEP